MTGPRGQVFIGTSGWSYAHWRDAFYPPSLATGDFLAFYASLFPVVELNSSFYHLPREATIARWVSVTPRHFRFALKASRVLTHRLRLRDCAEPLGLFLRLARGFGDRLGPLLFQLPPGLHCDAALLADFLEFLPRDLRLTFEFRHQSWYNEAVFALLATHRVALCFHDFRGCEAPHELTSSFVYVRLHGPQAPYTGSYNSAQLASWAGLVDTWASSGRDVYVFFNNDVGAHAVANARQLRALVND